MIEQEMASIIKFALDNAGNPFPYYWNVQENFKMPAMSFSTPEILTSADTLNDYGLEYSWNIKVFAETSQRAYSLAFGLVESVRLARNLIPLVDEDGNALANNYVRIKDPSMRVLDTGVCQITIEWVSRRNYQRKRDYDAGEKMQEYDVTAWLKGSAYEEQAVTEEDIAEAEVHLGGV